MAGAGVRVFQPGEVLTAALVNTYLQDQVVCRFDDEDDRDAAFGGVGQPVLEEGRICYLDSSNALQYFDGSDWVTISPEALLSVVQAKGDLIVGTAANSVARLATAADGRVLTTDATTATGLAWNVPSVPDGTITSEKIANNTIVNEDINVSAAIALSKLASGTSAQVIVANSSGVPAYATITGDIAISSTGAVTIQPDAVALGTDTTGNYVASLVAGTGITITNNTGEGATPTIAVTGSTYQPLDAELTALAGTTSAADALPYFTGSGTATTTTLTSAARSILDDASTTAIRTTLGVGTTDSPAFAGATIDAVQVGITAVNEIDTTAGNLIIDSAGGTTTVDDNLIVSGDLTVNGTTTTVNTATLNVSDNIVVLNNDVTGTPTENAGIEVERGTSTNVLVRWNETNDVWEYTNDGTTYFPIVGTTASQTLTNKTVALGNNTVSGTKAEFDTAVTDDNFAYLGTAQTFTANQAVTGTITTRAAATQDAVVLQGRAGGTNSRSVTLTPASLSASRTLTLPDKTGTVLTDTDLGANVSTFLATPSSANLASAVTDETGSGALVFGTSPTITPAAGTTTTATTGAGYMGMPQTAPAAAMPYTLLASDAGKHIYVTTTGTVTIPANGTTAFPIGTTIVIVSANGVTTTVSITTDTLRLANSTSTGSRTIASNGMATLLKLTSTLWIISGNGVT